MLYHATRFVWYVHNDTVKTREVQASFFEIFFFASHKIESSPGLAD
jgi:hypothetical protein